MPKAPKEIIAARFLKQAGWCEKLGSPLYAALLRAGAADVGAEGVCWEVLRGHHDDPPGSALALRFLGAVHRVVLEGRAEELAACYPSAGGRADGQDLWARFEAVVERHTAGLRELVCHPVQTNEVGRCAALLGGFLEIARRTRLPLRLLELGAAAGLILRWDHYRYESGGEGWGDPASGVRFSDVFAEEHSGFDTPVEIVERSGCDLSPIDPASEEGKLTLESYVWGDQVERLQQLRAAVEIARRVPATVVRANLADWIEAALEKRARGAATVVFHCIVWQYLSAAERNRVERAVLSAGHHATSESPLAYLRFEAGSGNMAELRLQVWPTGEERVLARAGFHGRPVDWLGDEKKNK